MIFVARLCELMIRYVDILDLIRQEPQLSANGAFDVYEKPFSL